MSKALVKQNINCLENPLWFQDEQLAQTSEDGYVWRNDKGYVFRAGYKPPVKTDGIFLLYLLLQCQLENWAEEITLTRYQVVNGCGLSHSQVWYDRLEDSLKRWAMVGIEYHGVFYDKKEYDTMFFGIIDSWDIEKGTKLLKVRFSPQYLKIMRSTTFCRYLNFDQLKALRSPLATRLYELLIKNFKGRLIWETEAVKLAEKIPMAEKYPAHILSKIRPAINRISKYTDLQLSLDTRKNDKGEVILIFQKLYQEEFETKTKSKPKEVGRTVQPKLQEKRPPEKKEDAVKPQDKDYEKLLLMLPFERQAQKSLQETIWFFFKKKGFEYVKWNIKYSNEKAGRNFPAYLTKSLKGNYGRVLQEETEIGKEADQKRREMEKVRIAKEEETKTHERAEADRAQMHLNTLSESERKDLEGEVLNRLPASVQPNYVAQDRRQGQMFQSLVRAVVLEKLNAGTNTKKA